LAKQFGLTEDAIKKAGKALEEDKDKLVAIADQTENIARASLTAQASENLLNSDLGDEVIDSFAQSVGGKGEEEAQKNLKQKLKTAYDGWGDELQTNE
jgi:hypothetical protein